MALEHISPKHSPAECYWRLERDMIIKTLDRIESKVDKAMERFEAKMERNSEREGDDHDDLLVLKTKWALMALLIVFAVNLLFAFFKWWRT